MNERIRELAQQARLGRGPEKIHISENGVVIFYLDEVEKFAELIVRECAEVASGPMAFTDAAYCRVGLLKHFGIQK